MSDAKIISSRPAARRTSSLRIASEAEEREKRGHARTTRPYDVRGGAIVWLRQTRDGTVIVPLANFSARIEAEVIRDNDVDEERRLRIAVTLADGRRLRPALVAASEFAGMGWVIRECGPGAIVNAGTGKQDHLRAAIQHLSGDVPAERRYTHTGWHEIEDGSVVYLHADGAIGADGLRADVAVELEGTLARFALPDPAQGKALIEAIRANLRLLDLAPDAVMVPLLAGVWRAPLGGTDFTLHLAGPTGVGKTELAALAQQHYGPAMDARHLPSTWESTANANEELCFLAKDALIVVDDFTAGGSAADAARRQRDAERLLRAQGNRAGRQRMRQDTSLRAAHPPRGVILSTGEDVPRGQSLRARILALELGADELRWDLLGACQRDARDGLYAAAMAGYLRYLAPRYRNLRETLRADVENLRERLPRGGHARVPTTIAELALGLHHFLAFAQDAGALSADEAEALWRRAAAAFLAVAEAQAEHQADYDPATRFPQLLAAALASGAAHVSGPAGEAPENAASWGWRREPRGGDVELRPQGPRVGWLSGDDLYLQPDAALKAARLMAGDGEALAGTPRTLHKALRDRGLLVSSEPKRFMVRRALGGMRQRVLHVRSDFVLSHVEDAVQAVLAVQDIGNEHDAGPDSGPLPHNDAESGPGEWSMPTRETSPAGPDGPQGPHFADERPGDAGLPGESKPGGSGER